MTFPRYISYPRISGSILALTLSMSACTTIEKGHNGSVSTAPQVESLTSSSANTSRAIKPLVEGNVLLSQGDHDGSRCNGTQSIQSLSGTGTRVTIATLRTSYEGEIQYYSNKLYFITIGGELGVYNLRTHRTSVFALPGVSPQQLGEYCIYDNANLTLRDILILGDTLFYLRGACGDTDRVARKTGLEKMCRLHAIHLSTGEITQIANLATYILSETEGMAFLPVISTGATLAFWNLAGNAFSAVSVYAVNTNTGEVQSKEEFQLGTFCRDACSPEESKKKEQYLSLDPIIDIQCGGWSLEQGFNYLSYQRGSISESLDSGAFIACVKP